MSIIIFIDDVFADGVINESQNQKQKQSRRGRLTPPIRRPRKPKAQQTKSSRVI